MFRRYKTSYRKNRSKAQYYPSSARSFKYPTYYQRIGRTIQTTPGRIPRSPYTILSQPELERMYRTLVQYKYQFPQPPVPPTPIQIQPFMIIQHLPFSLLFTSAHEFKFHPAMFKTVMDEYILNQYPLLWQEYQNWRYQLYYLSIQNVTESETVGYQFQIQLNHGLFQTNPFGLVMKTVTAQIAGSSISPTITIQPYSATEVRAYRIALTNSGNWQQSSSNIASNDPNPSDQGLYPIMDSSATPGDLYFSDLEYVQEGGNTPVNLRIIMHVVCAPIEDY